MATLLTLRSARRSVTLPGSGGTVSFKYDPFGRRIYKSSSSGASVFAYDGDNLIEETNSSGVVVARYEGTQNIDEPLAMLRSAATSYFHADGLGSISSLSNAAGSIANTYTYDSFGKLTASTGSLVNPFQYTARESDTETGLYYYRARYYDLQIGRFVNEDPIGFHGGEDFYPYAANEPTLLVDPTGLLAELYCEDIAGVQNRADGGPTKHCFLRIKCIGVDVTLELYGPVNRQAKKGRPEVNDFNRNRKAQKYPLNYPHSSSGCCGPFEDNVFKAFEQLAANLPDYNGLGPNSNTFVNGIIQMAGGSANFPPGAVGSGYTPSANH
jgi:RHS repeat-associated protein